MNIIASAYNLSGILLTIGFIAITLFVLHAVITNAVRNGINKSILNQQQQAKNQQKVMLKDEKKSFFDTDLDN